MQAARLHAPGTVRRRSVPPSEGQTAAHAAGLCITNRFSSTASCSFACAAEVECMVASQAHPCGVHPRHQLQSCAGMLPAAICWQQCPPRSSACCYASAPSEYCLRRFPVPAPQIEQVPGCLSSMPLLHWPNAASCMCMHVIRECSVASRRMAAVFGACVAACLFTRRSMHSSRKSSKPQTRPSGNPSPSSSALPRPALALVT